MKEKCVHLLSDLYCRLTQRENEAGDGVKIYKCSYVRGCYFKRLQKALKENRKIKHKKVNKS